MQRLVTCLWYEGEAEEAVAFYTSLFEEGSMGEAMRPGPGQPAVSVTFRLAGQEFLALNGRRGPGFTEAASILVRCRDQAEVDRLWDRLTAEGEEGRCGWLKDRWGVSWQIVPDGLVELLGDPDRARAGRALEAMLGMSKLDLAEVQRAADGVVSGTG